MTDDHDPADSEPHRPGDVFEPDELDGHTIDELSDYLDANRQPADPTIDNSPGCQIALDALIRLRTASWAMVEAEAHVDAATETSWISNILANISREARAGRDIPISHPDPRSHLHQTEGSIRGLIRAAGDTVDGALVGKVALEGDVTVPGTPISVTITASAAWGRPLHPLAEQMREAITADLVRHTELNVLAVDVTIDDIHPKPAAPHQDESDANTGEVSPDGR